MPNNMYNFDSEKVARSIMPIVFIIILSAFLWNYITQKTFIFNNTPKTVLELNKASPESEKLIVFYQPGCSDCKKVEKTIRQKTQKNVYLVNTKSPASRALVQHYDVLTTPTFIRIKKGNNLKQRYEGTDLNQIKSLYQGLS